MVVRLPAGMVLGYWFATVADTLTEKEQLPPPVVPPGIHAPAAIVALPAPTVAVMVLATGRVAAAPELKHEPLILSGVLTTRPAGKVSVSAVVVKIGTRFGLEMVMVSVLEPIAKPDEVGLNDLVTVGGPGWSMQLPVSP